MDQFDQAIRPGEVRLNEMPPAFGGGFVIAGCSGCLYFSAITDCLPKVYMVATDQDLCSLFSLLVVNELPLGPLVHHSSRREELPSRLISASPVGQHAHPWRSLRKLSQLLHIQRAHQRFLNFSLQILLLVEDHRSSS